MLSLLALAAVTVASCPVEQAHYALRHAPGVSARFVAVESGRDWPSGVARRGGEAPAHFLLPDSAGSEVG
jgi:hypothetical protein